MSSFSDWENFRRRHLPHLDRSGVPTFVTFRLAESLPREVLISLMEQSRQWAKEYSVSTEGRILFHKRVFARLDKYLDESYAQGKSPAFLSNSTLAKIVVKHLEWGVANKRYLLHAWCVMPNHVHIVIETLPMNYQFRNDDVSWSGAISRGEEAAEMRFNARAIQTENLCGEYWTLNKVLQGLKGVSAREINKSMGNEGSVWQNESFDHVIRSESEYYRVLDYIGHNPVVAGLAAACGEHPFTKIVASMPENRGEGVG